LPRQESSEPDSNAKAESARQFLKQYSEIVRTDAGIQIDCSNEQSENADLPKIETLEPGSNLTDETESQE
jgi:hypothetical protein